MPIDADKFSLRCLMCGHVMADADINRCPVCGGTLEIVYDLDRRSGGTP